MALKQLLTGINISVRRANITTFGTPCHPRKDSLPEFVPQKLLKFKRPAKRGPTHPAPQGRVFWNEHDRYYLNVLNLVIVTTYNNIQHHNITSTFTV